MDKQEIAPWLFAMRKIRCARMSENSPLEVTGPSVRSRFWTADTTFLKFASVILIVNSHMESLYPRPWMAGDGLLGMAWFFAIAGFGLVLSERGRPRPLIPWYYRRIIRIYPAFWVTVFVAEILGLGQWRHWTAANYVTKLIWPTDLNFIEAIMPAYLVFFLFLKIRRADGYLIGFIVGALIFAGMWMNEIRLYTTHTQLDLGHRFFQATLFDFQMMLVGAWLATRIRDDGAAVPPTRFGDVLIVALLFGAYVAAKYCMIVQARFAWAFPVLYLLALVICVYLFRLSNSRSFLDFVHRPGILGTVRRDDFCGQSDAGNLSCPPIHHVEPSHSIAAVSAEHDRVLAGDDPVVVPALEGGGFNPPRASKK